MNIKFLAVITPPPGIYHGCSTRKTFWEERFTPVNITSFVRRKVRKHREIMNGEKYIILNISSKLHCVDKRGLNSSYSKDYMGRLCKCLTNSIDLRIKWSNNKNKSRFAIADITNQYFRKLLRSFKNSPYLGYKVKQVHNEPT